MASVSEVMENIDKLPKNTALVEVKGGNHSQFGYLGTLFMDNAAEIDLADQQRFTFENLIDFFHKIENEK